MKVYVLGTPWKITALSCDAFSRRFGEHLAGITCPYPDLEVVFGEDELCIATVRHELFHAAYASLCLHAARINKHNQEEIMCELFSHHGPALLKLANTIYKALK